MTNADFRKLLQTPRRTDAPTPAGGSKGGVNATPRRSSKPKPWTGKGGKPGAKGAAEGDDEPKYRCGGFGMDVAA